MVFTLNAGVLGAVAIPGPVITNLSLWLDGSDIAAITKTYQNLAATGSGVSTTNIITASTDQTNLIQPGEKLRIGGTDIYTVSSVASTTITTVEALINNYVAQPMALDRVSQWNDKSSNGYNATQGTASKQPVYNAGQLNGKSVLDFNGSNTLVLPSGVYSIPNGANTSFFVAKRNSESGSPARIVAIDQSTNFKYLLTYGATSGDALFGNTNTASFATLPGNINTNYQIITGKYDGGTGLYVQSNNGTPATASSGAAVSTIDNAYIGSANDTSRYLLGPIAEILIYNRALTDIEIAQVNYYLSNKWNISIAPLSWTTWDGSKDGAFTSIPTSGDMDDMCNFAPGRSLVAYLDSSTNQINVIVATTSGTTVTYPTSPQAIDPTANYQATIAALDTGRVLVCYFTVTGVWGVVVSIDTSNNITVGTPKLLSAGSSLLAPRLIKLAANQCLLTWSDETITEVFNATCVTVTGTTVDNPHAILPVDAYVPAIYNVTPLSTTSAFIAYNSDDGGNGVQGIQLTIAANTVSAFSSQNIVPSSIAVQSLLTCQAIDATHIVVAYGDDNAALGKAFVVTITDGSGNMIFGSSVDFNTGAVAGNTTGSSNPLCFIDPATMMILFTSESAPVSGNACILAINGTTVAPYSPVQLALGNYSNLLGVLLNPNQILSGGSMNPTGGAGTQILSIV